MSAAEVASTLARELDTGWRERFDAWVVVEHVDGSSLVVSVEPDGGPVRRYRLTVEEVTE